MRLIVPMVTACVCLGALSACGGNNLGSCAVHSGWDAVIIRDVTEPACEQQCELPTQACTWTPNASQYPG